MKKKINLLIVFMFMMFIGLGSVNAATFSLDKKEVNVSTNKNDSVFIMNFSGVTPNDYKLEYEPNFLEKKEANGLTTDNKFVIESGIIKFSVKKNLNLEKDKKIDFILRNISSNESKTVASIIIKANKPKPKPEAPTTVKTTVATTVPTTTAVPKSNNADLESIEITDYNNNKMVYTPEFNSGVYEYTLEVSSDVKKLNYTVKAVDEKANIVISDNAYHELVAGDNNRIVITVTAEDGTQKAYYINVKRNVMETDATLKSLTISNVPEFKFKSDKFTYNLKLDKKIKKLNIDYETISENANVTITGNDKLKDGSKVKILVTAEDGSKREYILNISYEEDKKEVVDKPITETIVERNPVIIMLLSMVAFGLIGGIVYISKK